MSWATPGFERKRSVSSFNRVPNGPRVDAKTRGPLGTRLNETLIVMQISRVTMIPQLERYGSAVKV